MKKLKLFALAILAMGVCMNLTSCNDDDDDSKGSLRGDASIITTDDYKQWVVTYANEYNYSYDNNGQCIKIGDNWDLSDPKNPIYNESTSWIYNGKFSYTGSGYVSKMSLNADYERGGKAVENDNISISISYNKSDQITKISTSRTWEDYDDGSKDVNKETSTLSYVDGNLINIYISGSYDSNVFEGQWYTSKGTYEYTYTFEYGNEENKYWQNLQYRCFYDYGSEYIGSFAPIGWLGKGSKNLPTSYSYTYTENGSVREYGPYELNYSLNDEGLYAGWRYEEFKNAYILADLIEDYITDSGEDEYAESESYEESESVDYTTDDAVNVDDEEVESISANKSLVETQELERQNREDHHTHYRHHYVAE